MSVSHSARSHDQTATSPAPLSTSGGLAAKERRQFFQASLIGGTAFILLAALPVALLQLGPPPRQATGPVMETVPVQPVVEQQVPVPVTTSAVATSVDPRPVVVVAEEPAALPVVSAAPSPSAQSALLPQEPAEDNALTIMVPDGKGGTQLVVMDFSWQKEKELEKALIPTEAPRQWPTQTEVPDPVQPMSTQPQQTHWIPGQGINQNLVPIRNAYTGQVVGYFVPGTVTPYQGNIHGELPSPSINPFSLLKRPGTNLVGYLPFPTGKSNGFIPAGPGNRPNQMIPSGGPKQVALLQNQVGAKMNLTNTMQGGGKASFQVPALSTGMGKASGGMPTLPMMGGGKASGTVPIETAAACKCPCKK